MRNRRRNWVLRRFVLGLAIAAIAAPMAQARVDEGPAAAKGGAFVQGVTDFPRAAAQASRGGLVFAHDDKVLAPTSQIPVRADDKVLVPVPGEPVLVAGKADGIDWGDAGIGAGLASGLMLILGAAALASRHIGRPVSA